MSLWAEKDVNFKSFWLSFKLWKVKTLICVVLSIYLKYGNKIGLRRQIIYTARIIQQSLFISAFKRHALIYTTVSENNIGAPKMRNNFFAVKYNLICFIFHQFYAFFLISLYIYRFTNCLIVSDKFCFLSLL